eukprot:scaffold191119_cov46-Cyclotella_meneghiniana.AAC.3
MPVDSSIIKATKATSAWQKRLTDHMENQVNPNTKININASSSLLHGPKTLLSHVQRATLPRIAANMMATLLSIQQQHSHSKLLWCTDIKGWCFWRVSGAQSYNGVVGGWNYINALKSTLTMTL